MKNIAALFLLSFSVQAGVTLDWTIDISSIITGTNSPTYDILHYYELPNQKIAIIAGNNRRTEYQDIGTEYSSVRVYDSFKKITDNLHFLIIDSSGSLIYQYDFDSIKSEILDFYGDRWIEQGRYPSNGFEIEEFSEVFCVDYYNPSVFVCAFDINGGEPITYTNEQNIIETSYNYLGVSDSISIFTPSNNTYSVDNIIGIEVNPFYTKPRIPSLHPNTLYVIDNSNFGADYLFSKYTLDDSNTEAASELDGNIVSGHVSSGFYQDNYVLSWESGLGIQYQIQSSTNLIDWNPTGHTLTGTGYPMTWANHVTNSQAFYRVVED